MNTSIFNPHSISINDVIEHLMESDKHSVTFEAEDNQTPEANSIEFQIDSIERLISVIQEINEMLYYDILFVIDNEDINLDDGYSSQRPLTYIDLRKS